jgi:DNA-directed RNA polymerase specialized sigma24 family protein
MDADAEIAAEMAAAVNAGFEEAGRQEARRLRQEEGMSYEAIAKRLSLEPAEVYSAVTGKTGAQVETWKRKHGGEV